MQPRRCSRSKLAGLVICASTVALSNVVVFAVAQQQKGKKSVTKTETTQSTPVDVAEIKKWVRDLASDKFIKREKATQNLLKAGKQAVEPITEAMASADLETRLRAKTILSEFFKSNDEDVKAAARTAVEKLANSGDHSVAAWAEDLIAAEHRITVVAALTAQDPIDKLRQACHYKSYKVKMQRRRQYVIELVGNFDTYIRVEDQAGRHLAEDDDSGGGLNSRLVFQPPRDGEYRVIVTSFSPATGNFTLNVRWSGRK